MGKKKKQKKLKKAKQAKLAKQVVIVHPPAGHHILAAVLSQAIAAGLAYGVARYAAARPAPRAQGLGRFVARHPHAAWDLALWQGGERLKAFGEHLRRRFAPHDQPERDPPAPHLTDQRRPR